MKRINKKVNELVLIIEKFGYWSDEVKEFNIDLDYELMTKVNNRARGIIKEKNRCLEY